MIKITLEYASLDEAIVALGKLVGGKAGRAARSTGAAPVNTAATPLLVAEAGVATPATTTPEAAPTKRKGRSDKGQPRGPHKGTEAAAAGASTDTAGSAPVPTTAAAVEVSTKAAAPAKPDDGDKPAPAGIESPVAAATAEQAQKALEKVFADRGLIEARALLSGFGIDRLLDLKPEQYGAFVAKAQA